MNHPKATNADLFGFLGRSFLGHIKSGRNIAEAAAATILDTGSASAASAEAEEDHWHETTQTETSAPAAIAAEGTPLDEEPAQ